MLERLFLLCCFFPFVSPVPISSDVQPLAGIFGLLVLIKHNLLLGHGVPRRYATILFFGLFFLLYYNPFAAGFNADWGKMMSLAFGAVILLAFYYSQHRLSRGLINSVIGIYFIFSLLLVFFTAPMIEVQNLLVRNTNTVEFGYRGVATFSTEPGLFGGLLVFFLLVVDFVKDKGEISKRNQYVLYGLLITMLYLTKSGTGYLYFFLYFSLRFFLSGISIYYKAIAVSVFPLIGLLAIGYLNQLDPTSLGRGSQIMAQLSEPMVLINDSSIMTRIVDASLTFYAITALPFGVGNGQTISAASELMNNTPFVKDFYEMTNKGFALNSSFTYLSISYGVFFWFYIVFLYAYFSKSSFACKFFSLLFLTFSYSAAFPAIWLLLGLKVRCRPFRY